ALARRGAAVTVLEQAPAIIEVGAGLQVSPNGARVLRALGLGEALAATGLAAEAVELREGATGREVLRLDLRRGHQATDGGYFFLHRADLVTLLLDAAVAAGARVKTACRVEGLTLRANSVLLRLDDGTSHAADLLVGADGLHSVVRQQLEPEAQPFFTGQVAWRAVIAETAAAAPVAQVFMGPGRHLVSYPLRGGRARNLVAVEERSSWAAEGWHHRDDPERLRAAFAGFGGPVPGWLAALEEAHLWGLFRHEVVQRWHQGACVLAGDAAHPTLPFLAQGANMALEDAWVLADALAREPTREAAFGAYQAARERRVRRIVAAAEGNARVYHLAGPARWVAQRLLGLSGRVAPGLALRRFDWLYGHDVTAGASQRPA
ncbi:MAG: monooxygenase, partial [Gammaproteobacteria bacterium]